MIQQIEIKLLFVKLSPLALGILCTSFIATVLFGYQAGLWDPLRNSSPLITSFICPSFPSLLFLTLLFFLILLISLWLVNFFLQKARYQSSPLRRCLLAGLPLIGLSSSLLYFPPQETTSAYNLIFLGALAICLALGLALFTIPYLRLLRDIIKHESSKQAVHFYWPALFSLGALLAFCLLSGSASPPELNLNTLKTPGLILNLASLLSLTGLILIYAVSPCQAQSEPDLVASLKAIWQIKDYKKFLYLELFTTACSSTFFFAFPHLNTDLMLGDSLFGFSLAKLLLLLACLCPAGLWYLTRFIKPHPILPLSVLLLSLGLAMLALTNLWPNPGGIPFDTTTSVTVTNQNEVVFGSIRGALVWDGQNWQLIDQSDGLIADEVLCVLCAEKGLWFGTKRGASFWDRQNWTHYSKASGLIDNEVLKIIVKGDSIWFGTPKGISLLEDAAFHQFIPPVLKGENASAIVTDFALSENDDLWVGTSAGLYSYQEGIWTYYNTSKGLPDENITALLTISYSEDAFITDEILIIGTQRGAASLSLKQKTWSYLNKANGLPANQVTSLKALSGGQLFIATIQGLFITDPFGNSRSINHHDGLVHDLVVDVAQAQDGTLWFATPYGVSAFKNGLWQNYQSLLPKIWGSAFALITTLALMGYLIFSTHLNYALCHHYQQPASPTIYLGFRLWHLSVRLLGLSLGLCMLYSFYHYFGQSAANPQGLRFCWLCSAFLGLVLSLVFMRQVNLNKHFYQ